MIRRHIQRGDIYPQTQRKCWKHIRRPRGASFFGWLALLLTRDCCHCYTELELQDFACFAVPTAEDDCISSPSPSRGKLRPGKELIVLSEERNQDANSQEPSASLSDDEEDDAEDDDSAEPDAGEAPQPAVEAKKFSSLSMMERQALWLQKKQAKMEAERLRQEEEKEKDLTFQPKLVRRSTFSERPSNSSGGSSRILTSTGGSYRKIDMSEPTNGRIKSAGPKERAITRPRRKKAQPKAVQLAGVPVSQPIEISSNLLSAMRSELETSKANGLSSSAAATVEPPSGPEPTAVTAATETAALPPPEVKAWSDSPVFGSLRIDFDSSETKARLTLQDAAKFELSSMYRKTDKFAGRDGVALHMGRREDTFEEEVIAVLFDKDKVSELDAARWWTEHQSRFAQYYAQTDSSGGGRLTEA